MDKRKLQKLICDSEIKLAGLKAIEYDSLKECINELESCFNEFKESGEKLLSSEDVLQIGIVGQVKAGKSSFLNSLFFNGENVLPRASTPMTAGLTVIEYSEKNSFEVEYFNEKDWDIFLKQDEDYKKYEQEVRAQNPDAPEKIIIKEIENRTSEKIRSAHELVSSCSNRAKQKIGSENDSKEFYDIDDLQNVLEQYVGANGEYTPVVKSLYIKMKDERLQGLRIVDTPGVNDPVVSRENRTRTFLHSCHGVFLLSSSNDFLGSGDISFLNTRIGASGIGAVVILASKFDSVLQDIGSDYKMKNQEVCDLVDAIDNQKRKFRNRLRELSDTIDEKLRDRIKLDTTSGISYSIAHKDSSKWDNVEKNVVEQMKRFYPDYFTDEDLKETFEGLANIVEIRERYLDKLFVNNKENIISEKVREFFQKNKVEIYNTIERFSQEFKARKAQLNETTIAEIEKQKDIQKQMFASLEEVFVWTFSSFALTLQENIKTISNNIQFNEIRNVPTETVTESIRHKGMLWGHNNTDFEMETVNTYELSSRMGNSIDEYARSWNNEWHKNFEKINRELFEKLSSSISDLEMKLMSSSFNDVYYRNLLDRALDSLRKNNELSIGDIIFKFKRMADDISNKQFYPADTSELSQEEIPSYLRRSLRKHNENLIIELRNLTDSLIEDVRREVNKNLSEAKNVIDKMGKSFTETLKVEGEKYLASLEKDLADKVDVLKRIDLIIKNFYELSSLYN